MQTPNFKFSEEAADALAESRPVVALESTVIAHGLPHPENLEFALEVEEIIRRNGATPATIAVLAGVPQIGLNRRQIERLAGGDQILKLSRRDLPIAFAKKLDGATTVATTSFFAYRAGIKIFATGGIGGVHRGDGWDVSADLPELACTPITVVCAGAKSILNLPATREWLETNGICVVGWQTDDFPAFYTRRANNLKTDIRVETAEEAAEIIASRDRLKLENAILLVVPVPSEFEIPFEKAEKFLAEALHEANEKSIFGKEMTPFLLRRMAEQSMGATLAANLALLKQNARVAAQIAKVIS